MRAMDSAQAGTVHPWSLLCQVVGPLPLAVNVVCLCRCGNLEEISPVPLLLGF